MTVPSAREARSLGDDLARDPIAHANNAVTLLQCLQEPEKHEVGASGLCGC